MKPHPKTKKALRKIEKQERCSYNINHIKDIIIFAFIGAVISAIYVIIANMLDTTVRTKEDIEEKLGLSLLTAIPMCNFEHNMIKSSKGGKK